jgi:hypothetical protein
MDREEVNQEDEDVSQKTGKYGSMAMNIQIGSNGDTS